MGNIIARFKKKKNTKEVLELLEDEIVYMENMTSNTTPINYYKIIFHSALLYGLIYIFYYFGIVSYKIFNNKYILAGLAAYPIIALYYYKLDVWYYNRKILLYKKKLIELRSEKKKILDEVMENETFKVAKEILEKYAPDQLESMTPQNFIKKRVLASSSHKPQLASIDRSINKTPIMGTSTVIMQPPVKPKLLLPRPVLPRDRTIFDRLADIVLGDGPQNRFALICRTCGSHNGMARKEEFDFLAYRCAYCSQWNPSLKPRPQLAISYNDNGTITQNGQVTSTETIEEITDNISSKTHSDPNKSEHSEQKDLSDPDYAGPTIEEMDDIQPSEDINFKTKNVEEEIVDKSTPNTEELS